MNIDNKLNLPKNNVSENSLGKKNLHATIDQSMVASTEQKNVGMDLPEDHGPDGKAKKKNKNKKILAKKSDDDEALLKKDEKKIERDPLKLLRLL